MDDEQRGIRLRRIEEEPSVDHQQQQAVQYSRRNVRSLFFSGEEKRAVRGYCAYKQGVLPFRILCTFYTVRNCAASCVSVDLCMNLLYVFVCVNEYENAPVSAIEIN